MADRKDLSIHGGGYFSLRPGRCSNQFYRGKRVNKGIQAWFEEGRDILYPQFARKGAGVRSAATPQPDQPEVKSRALNAENRI